MYLWKNVNFIGLVMKFIRNETIKILPNIYQLFVTNPKIIQPISIDDKIPDDSDKEYSSLVL